MKRKVLFICLISLVLISALLTGCLPKPSTSTTSGSTPATATDTAQNKRLDAVESKVAKLESTPASSGGGVSQDSFNSLQSKVNSLETSMGNKANQADLTALQTKINALEATIAELEEDSDSSDGGSSSSGNGELVDTNKDLKLYLTEINPSTDPLLLSKTDDLRFEFEVENSSATSEQFEVIITLYSTENGMEVLSTSDFDIFGDNSMSISASPLDTVLANGGAFVIRCDDGWVGKNDTIQFTVIIDFRSNFSSEWDYNIDIRQTT